MNRIIIIMTIIAIGALTTASRAQDVALKTNLINDALLSPNVGVELGLAPKWTMDVNVEANLWTVNGHKWKHAFVRPEARYWLCQRFTGHFIGAMAIGGIYNFGNLDLGLNMLGSDLSQLKDKRYQGWAAGAGILYGYARPVHKHWNIEAAIGIGWIYTRFDSYPCAECGTKIDRNKVHNYFGPTKAALSVVYIF